MKKYAPFLIILGSVFWGLSGLFVRFLSGYGLSSLDISCIRIISAAVILFLAVLAKDRRLLKIRLLDVWIFILGGSFSVFMTCVCYFNTISLSSVSAACILMYTAPVFVLTASFFLFGEKITKKKLFAMLSALLGCVCVSGIFESGLGSFNRAAFISGILSGIAYASYSIFGKLALKKYKPLTYTVYSFIFAAAVAALAMNRQAVFKTAFENPFLFGFYPFMGLVISVIPYILYTLGLSGTESGTASVLSTVEPLVATLVGVFVLAEPISIISLLGVALIILSVVILR